MPGGQRPEADRSGPPAAELPGPPAAEFPRPPRPRQWDVLAVIALGGGLGSTARYGLAQAWPTTPGTFPWATFTTNVSGSLLLGLLMVHVLEIWPPSRYLRPFLGVGILGGFTTFSTYTVEVRGLLAGGRVSLADAYALSSLVAGLAAVWTGMALARLLGRLPVRRGPRRRGRAARPGAVTPEAGHGDAAGAARAVPPVQPARGSTR